MRQYWDQVSAVRHPIKSIASWSFAAANQIRPDISRCLHHVNTTALVIPLLSSSSPNPVELIIVILELLTLLSTLCATIQTVIPSLVYREQQGGPAAASARSLRIGIA